MSTIDYSQWDVSSLKQVVQSRMVTKEVFEKITDSTLKEQVWKSVSAVALDAVAENETLPPFCVMVTMKPFVGMVDGVEIEYEAVQINHLFEHRKVAHMYRFLRYDIATNRHGSIVFAIFFITEAHLVNREGQTEPISVMLEKYGRPQDAPDKIDALLINGSFPDGNASESYNVSNRKDPTIIWDRNSGGDAGGIGYSLYQKVYGEYTPSAAEAAIYESKNPG